MVRKAAGLDERPLLEVEPEVGPGGGGLVPAWVWLPWRDTVLHVVVAPGAPEVDYPAALARWGADLDVVVVDPREDPATVDAVLDLAEQGRPAVVVVARTRPGQASEALLDALGRVSGRRPVRTWHAGLDVGPVGVCLLSDPPADATDDVVAAREALIERVAEVDEAALEAFAERGSLTEEEAWSALARATASGTLLPVYEVDSALGEGGGALLDALVRLAPAPEGRPDAHLELEVVGVWLDGEGAQVTMVRVAQGTLQPQATVRDTAGRLVRLHKPYRVRGPRRAVADLALPGETVGLWEPLDAVPGETLGAEGRSPPSARPPLAWRRVVVDDVNRAARLEEAVATLLRLDPALRASRVARGVLDVAGPSRGHLDLLLRRLQGLFRLEVGCAPAPLDLQERPTGSGTAEGRSVRPDRGEEVERATLSLELGPSEDDAPLWLEIVVDEEDLPPEHRPAVEEGILRALAEGGPQGHPVVGVHARVVAAWVDLLDGDAHHVAEAAADAARAALRVAGTRVWEPWSDVLLLVAEETVGAVLSEVGGQRGRTEGLDVTERETSIRARVPDSRLEALGARIAACTRRRGWMFVRPSHHEPLAERSEGAGTR